MKTDLHMHSFYSDGLESPADLTRIAKENGLEQIALTDHDTFSGVDLFLTACRSYGLRGVAAAEMSFGPEDERVKYKSEKYKSEILGYFPSGIYESTQQILSQQLKVRQHIAEISLQIAREKYGLPEHITTHDIVNSRYGDGCLSSEELLQKISITKPNIYEFLADNIDDFAFVHNYRLFKKEFFAHNYFAGIRDYKKTAKQVITAINNDGGLSVLAHPMAFYNFKVNDDIFQALRQIILEFKDYGLWGIELHSCNGNSNVQQINEALSAIALDLHLKTTYGSDHHGVNSTRGYLGEYYGEMEMLLK